MTYRSTHHFNPSAPCMNPLLNQLSRGRGPVRTRSNQLPLVATLGLDFSFLDDFSWAGSALPEKVNFVSFTRKLPLDSEQTALWIHVNRWKFFSHSELCFSESFRVLTWQAMTEQRIEDLHNITYEKMRIEDVLCEFRILPHGQRLLLEMVSDWSIYPVSNLKTVNHPYSFG
jgi:hypothetical protein